MTLTKEQINEIKKCYETLLKEQKEEGGHLYVDPDDEDDLPW
jgi:hypothetical protein